LIAFPDRAGVGTFAAGGLNGWLALLLVVAVVIAFDKALFRRLSVSLLAASLIAAGSLLAFKIARFGVIQWAGLHVLLAALILIPWILLFASDLPRVLRSDEQGWFARFWHRLGFSVAEDWQSDALVFATFIGASTILVALRGPFRDPQGAWWSIAALLAMCALAAALNWTTLHRGYLYAAGILLNVATSIWLIEYRGQQISSLTIFVEANIVALSLAGIIWLVLELRARQHKSTSNTAASFHNVAALCSLLTMSALVVVGLFAYVLQFYRTPAPRLEWVALFSVAAFIVACLWDRGAGYAVAGLYLIGLLLTATFLGHLELTAGHLIWSLMIAGAVYALLATAVWRARAPLMEWATRLKIPLRVNPTVTELNWLNVFNCLAVALVITIALWSELNLFEWPLRMLAAIAV